MIPVTVKKRGQRPTLKILDADKVRSEQIEHARAMQPAQALIVRDSPQTAQYFLKQVASTITLLFSKVEGLPPDLRHTLRQVRSELDAIAAPLEQQAKEAAATRKAEKQALAELMS